MYLFKISKNQPIILVLLKLINYFFLFIASVFITNELTLDGRGEYSYLLGFASICLPLINLGFGQSLQYHAANNLFQGRVKSVLLRHLFATSIILSFIVLFYNFNLVYGLFLIISLAYLNFIKHYTGKGNLYYHSFFETSKPLLLIVLALCVESLIDIRILFIVQILAMTGPILYIYKTNLRSASNITFGDYKAFYSYGLKAWLSDIFNRGTAKLDILLLGSLLSMENIAYYTVLFVISESLWLIPDGLAPWLFRKFASSQDVQDRRFDTIRYVVIVFVLSGLLGLFLYAVLIEGAFVYLYGERYSNLVPLLSYAIFTTLMLVPSKVVSKYFAATGAISIVTIINVIGVIAMLISFYSIRVHLNLENALILNFVTYSVMSLVSIVLLFLWRR